MIHFDLYFLKSNSISILLNKVNLIFNYINVNII